MERYKKLLASSMEEEGCETAIQVPPVHLLVSTYTAETVIAGHASMRIVNKTCSSEG
jgi:hypothetical protein